MPIFGGLTDAIGLTDYGGAESARRSSNRALGEISGTSRELLDWWKTNAAPYQLGLMERGTALYDEAAPTEADYSRALGQASEDVARSYGLSRDMTSRNLMRYGVDPSSGRFRSAMTTSANAQAAADAAARNSARMGLRDTSFARKSQALGLGASLNAPNYGLVGAGLGGLGTAAGGYGATASGLEQQNLGAIGGLVSGAGFAVGKKLGFGANGGEARDLSRRNYANGGPVGGLTYPRYNDAEEVRGLRRREKFMGDAMVIEEPLGLQMPRQLRGEMRGPGTPISDDIPVRTEDGGDARLADGEVVMPTDTVAALGLQLMRSNPEKAAHMIGVKLLEEQIDQTHEPAEEQQKYGLSVDPRGRGRGRMMGAEDSTQYGLQMPNRGNYANGGAIGLTVPRRSGIGLTVPGRPAYANGGVTGPRMGGLTVGRMGYADGGEEDPPRMVGLTDPRRIYEDEEQDSRPSLGTGLAERAARTLEEARRRRMEALAEAEGYANGGPVGGLTVPRRKNYADGGMTDSAWGTALSALGHGLANAYSRGQWVQGLQAGQQAGALEQERARLSAEQARQDRLRTGLEEAAQQSMTPDVYGGQGSDQEAANILSQGPVRPGLNVGQYTDRARQVYAKEAPEKFFGLVTEEEKAKRDAAAKERELELKYGKGFGGPFSGSSMDAQVFNSLVEYNRKKQAGIETTPDEDMAYSLSYGRASKPQRYTTPEGTMYEVQGMDLTGFVPPASSAPAGGGPRGTAISKKPKEYTEGQTTAAGYADRMIKAGGLIAEFESSGYAPGLREKITSGVPLGNYAQTPEYQAYQQAQRDWVRAKLRKESGAVIGIEEEREEIATYFPQPGDSAEVIRQKAAARATAENVMKEQSRGAYDAMFGARKTDQPRAARNAPTQAGSAASQSIPRVTSDQEFNALPSGAMFIGPDGARRRKP